MIRADVCYLVSEAPGSHGIFDDAKLTERMVYCTVRSVYANEFWRAKDAGSDLSLVFRLADYDDYGGERLVRYENKYYRVSRVYIDGLAIELTCEEPTEEVEPDD